MTAAEPSAPVRGPGVLPMFPLGSVLFPAIGLPLRVFEPRYRQMVADCLRGDAEFGVVLIERGTEVGGGDVRFAVGTVARILDARPLPDGTWAVTAAGMRRVAVEEWLPDDPYPLARVTDHPDPDEPDVSVLERTVARLRTLLARCSEAGDHVAPSTIELADDPVVALWQCCAILPVSPLDDLALLRAPSASARLTLLGELIDDADAMVSHRLTGA
jgi:Lon protease-like protein